MEVIYGTGRSGKNKRVIAVIGAQRSGTSAITRGLEVLGVNLGGYTQPEFKRADNEKGFFEDIEISVLDAGMLNSIGFTWDNPALPVFDENTMQVLSAFYPIAKNIIDRRFKSTDLFGFKEPSSAKLMPIWNKVFMEAEADVSYIIACRNPLSVAKSLQKRDNFDIVKGCYIWSGALISALVYSEGYNRIVIDYDEVMDNPQKQLERAAERLNLKFDPDSAVFKEYRDNFLSGSLRHTSFEAGGLLEHPDVPPKIAELYILLKKLAKDEVNIDGTAVAAQIKKIYSWAAELRSTLLYMQAQFDALLSLKGALLEREAKIAELTEALKIKNG